MYKLATSTEVYKYIMDIIYTDVWPVPRVYLFETEQEAREYAKKRIRNQGRQIAEIILRIPALEQITLYTRGKN